MSKSNHISQAEYARKRGVSRQRIHTLVKEGVIVLVNGRVDPVQADKAIYEATDPARMKKGVPPHSFQEARTLKENALARLREIEAKEKEGELVNAEEVQQEFVKMIVAAKTRLRSIPAKCAQEVAHLKVAKQGRMLTAEIQTLLLREIDEALEDLSNYKPRVETN